MTARLEFGVLFKVPSASRRGGLPNVREYSRLNWEGLIAVACLK